HDGPGLLRLHDESEVGPGPFGIGAVVPPVLIGETRHLGQQEQSAERRRRAGRGFPLQELFFEEARAPGGVESPARIAGDGAEATSEGTPESRTLRGVLGAQEQLELQPPRLRIDARAVSNPAEVRRRAMDLAPYRPLHRQPLLRLPFEVEGRPVPDRGLHDPPSNWSKIQRNGSMRLTGSPSLLIRSWRRSS